MLRFELMSGLVGRFYWGNTLIFFFIFASANLCARTDSKISIQEFSEISSKVRDGDLIFLETRCSEDCEAISKATEEQFGPYGPRLNHIGILRKAIDGRVFVLEVLPEVGVIKRDLQETLKMVDAKENQRHGFYIAHWRKEYRRMASRAAERVENKYLGLPYAENFSLSPDRHYCSSPVYFEYIFRKRHLFELFAMQFGAPGSKTREAFEAYYAAIGEPLPLDQPGINPRSIWEQGFAHDYFEPHPAASSRNYIEVLQLRECLLKLKARMLVSKSSLPHWQNP